MASQIVFKERKQPLLERFGVYYLGVFGKRELDHNVFDLTDEALQNKINFISRKGVFLSGLTGFLCVWPTVLIDLRLQNRPWLFHYSLLGGMTAIAVAIEFYLLFIIAIKAVHEVSELINIHSHKKDFLKSGPFNVTNILARTALELPDPEMQILGIDPFEQVSKRNLFILGLLYKLKIVITNFAAKKVLSLGFGPFIFGISIKYTALPVECFWNGMVIHRVVREARLRLMGFALSNHLSDHVLHDQLLDQLSDDGRTGCLRAIGNAVVMARCYHPNIIVLLLRFQHLLHIDRDKQYDRWDLFLQCLQKVSEKERYFLLDLFTIAVSLGATISDREWNRIKEAYGMEADLFRPRLLQLTDYIRQGRLHAAAELCKLDFSKG